MKFCTDVEEPGTSMKMTASLASTCMQLCCSCSRSCGDRIACHRLPIFSTWDYRIKISDSDVWYILLHAVWRIFCTYFQNIRNYQKCLSRQNVKESALFCFIVFVWFCMSYFRKIKNWLLFLKIGFFFRT